MSKRVVQVFEHEKLRLQEDSRGRLLYQEEFDSLVKFNDENDQKYFKIIYKGIQFSQYVGVVQVGNLTLEILPKADKTNNYENKETDQWRSALLSMLRICNKLSADAVSEAKLKRRKLSLLDLYFEMYLKEIEKLLHQGLFKNYKDHSRNILAWKGRVNFAKNIQHNLIRKDRFYSTHQIYSYDHTINRVLYKALSIIYSLTTDLDQSERTKNLLSQFPHIQERPIQESTFRTIKKSRKLKPYETALKIAEIIILNFSPEIKTGGSKLLALLFDMNKLWEEYLYRMLSRISMDSFKVSSQQSMRFWKNKLVRPDIILILDGITYVIDAKWKIIDRRNPGDADLKQMYVYNMYWGASRSMLLYPQSQLQIEGESFGKYHKGRDDENLCKLGFVNVLDSEGRLDTQIGYQIIEKLIA